MDQVARHLRGDARRRLRVLVDDLDRRTSCRRSSGPSRTPSSRGPSTYGSGSPKPAAGPVSGLTKPILIVWSASETRGAAQTCGAATPETARPPAPDARALEQLAPRNASCLQPCAPPGGGRCAGSRAGTLRRLVSRLVKTLFRLVRTRGVSASPRRARPLPRSRSSAASRSSRRSPRPGRCSASASSRGRSGSAARAPTATSRRSRRSATSSRTGRRRRYRLGPRVLDLGFSAINSMELRQIAARRPPGSLGRDRPHGEHGGPRRRRHRLHRALPQREPRPARDRPEPPRRVAAAGLLHLDGQGAARRPARRGARGAARADRLRPARPEHDHGPRARCSTSSRSVRERGPRGQQRGARLRAALDRRARARRRTAPSSRRSTSRCTARWSRWRTSSCGSRRRLQATAREHLVDGRFGWRSGSPQPLAGVIVSAVAVITGHDEQLLIGGEWVEAPRRRALRRHRPRDRRARRLGARRRRRGRARGDRRGRGGVRAGWSVARRDRARPDPAPLGRPDPRAQGRDRRA